MKKIGFCVLLLIFFVGTANTGFAQFNVGQSVKFKTFKKPKKDQCRYHIRQEIAKATQGKTNLNDKDNDIDWEFDDGQCKIFAIPPNARPNSVTVSCLINARITFLFGAYSAFNYTTKEPCIFLDINPQNLELIK